MLDRTLEDDPFPKAQDLVLKATFLTVYLSVLYKCYPQKEDLLIFASTSTPLGNSTTTVIQF
jgi:hypothetical protein